MDKLIQPALLAILAKEPLHGYELARRIGGIPNFLEQAPDLSGIYRFLKTLESRGLVVSSWDTSGNRQAKRLFEITAEGKKCLRHWTRTLENYRKAIDSLIVTTRNAVKDNR